MDVLIVDDQAGVRCLLEVIVREAGHRVHLAANGLEAVNLARAVRPRLVFMDIKMPVMNGIEALDRIKADMPETDVIMMTAYGTEEVVNQLKEKGVLCCIDKPFDIETVRSLLSSYDKDNPRCACL